jgi:hypothetical protein
LTFTSNLLMILVVKYDCKCKSNWDHDLDYCFNFNVNEWHIVVNDSKLVLSMSNHLQDQIFKDNIAILRMNKKEKGETKWT